MIRLVVFFISNNLQDKKDYGVILTLKVINWYQSKPVLGLFDCDGGKDHCYTFFFYNDI